MDPSPASIDPSPASIDPSPASIDPSPASIDPSPASIDPSPASMDPSPASIDPSPANFEVTELVLLPAGSRNLTATKVEMTSFDIFCSSVYDLSAISFKHYKGR
jgi:hypothetical protein